MKNLNSLLVAFSMLMATTLCVTSCQNEADGIMSNKADPNVEPRSNPNSAIYPLTSHPFGKSFDLWTQEFWSAAYALDCEAFGAGQVLTLDNNVVTYFGALIIGEVDITIPNKAIFLPIISILNDYPCPDPDFEPADGQSLEDFLREGAVAYIDGLENLEVILDGVALDNMDNTRSSTSLFYFTGNTELADCYDPCITGEPQAGVANGYYIMIKKLGPGQHTLTTRGEYPDFEFAWDVTLNITVE